MNGYRDITMQKYFTYDYDFYHISHMLNVWFLVKA
jgi:hypothetical protein